MNHLDELFFSIYIEKIEKKGEDAKPLIAINDTSILLGVFDGLGGAGSIQKYKIDGHDDYKSGAYLASRATYNIVEWFFHNYELDQFIEWELDKKKFDLFNSFSLKKDKDYNKGINLSIKKFLGHLQNFLREELQRQEEVHADKDRVSKLKSKSVKLLPSTMSLLYTADIQGKKTIFSFWAGDSRSYKLDASGLMQLTCDDIDEVDTSLESINSNAPMNNYINLSEKFHINHDFFIENETKQILISSSDGAFGVFDTPILFESAILSTLESSNSIKMWKSKLEVILKERQNDDISIIIYPIGFNDFDEIKQFYKSRNKLLNQMIQKHINIESDMKVMERQIDSLESVLNSKKRELEDMIVKEWDSYSQNYLKKLKHHYAEKRKE